jgi:hypothetical protein
MAALPSENISLFQGLGNPFLMNKKGLKGRCEREGGFSLARAVQHFREIYGQPTFIIRC